MCEPALHVLTLNILFAVQKQLQILFQHKYPSFHRLLVHAPVHARHLSVSAFCTGFSRLELPEQALDGIPLGLGSVVKINLLNFHAHILLTEW